MTRGEILTKVMAMAKRNGYNLSEEFFTEVPVETWLQEGQDFYFSLIFSHDFAICFFGNDIAVIDEFTEEAEDINLVEYENPMGLLMTNRKNIKIPMWQYHLVQMTLSEDPLMYLYTFVQDHEQANLN
jgi:hypothetical protein